MSALLYAQACVHERCSRFPDPSSACRSVGACMQTLLPRENTAIERVRVITGFAASENKAMNEVLLSAIQDIARTGNVCFRWGTLVQLLVYQLRVVLETSSESHPVKQEDALAGDESYQQSCNRLYALLAQFEGPPFTVQRLCELLSTPHKHHRTKLKLLAALDKLLSVTSVVPEVSQSACRTVAALR